MQKRGNSGHVCINELKWVVDVVIWWLACKELIKCNPDKNEINMLREREEKKSKRQIEKG
jgi:hypothetical protein